MMRFLVIFSFLTLIGIKSNAQSADAGNELMDTVYTIADSYPSYPGGEDAWKKYLKKNLKYPKKAWWEEIEGDVVMEFIVRKDGSITNIRYLTVSEWGFEAEATRLVKESNKWKPATKNGKPVNFKGKVTIPFRLRISKGEKE